jgi:hypothetical protein
MAKSKKQKNKRAEFMKFWANHPNYTAFVHVTLGFGLGLLAQTFLTQGDVSMTGLFVEFVGVVCLLYPFVM